MFFELLMVNSIQVFCIQHCFSWVLASTFRGFESLVRGIFCSLQLILKRNKSTVPKKQTNPVVARVFERAIFRAQGLGSRGPSRQNDRQTDRQTDRQNSAFKIIQRLDYFPSSPGPSKLPGRWLVSNKGLVPCREGLGVCAKCEVTSTLPNKCAICRFRNRAARSTDVRSVTCDQLTVACS